MFLYREVLKRSLKVTWDHKYLWFFGLFASLLGSVGRYDVAFSRISEKWNSGVFAGMTQFVDRGLLHGAFFSGLSAAFRNDPIAASISIVFLLIVFVLSLFLLWLAVVSQAGLINDAAAVLKSGDKSKPSTIKEGIEAGISRFWPVLGINVISVCLIFLFAAIVGLPLLFTTGGSDLTIALLYTLLFILFVPIAMVISFLGKLAVCYIVVKGRKFVDSLIEAIKLFEKNWLVCLEMALILLVVDLIFVLAIGLAVMVVAIPYLFAALSLSLVFAEGFFWLAAVAFMTMATIFVILAGSILTTFKLSAWTDIFINLVDKKGGLAKIVRLAEGLKR